MHKELDLGIEGLSKIEGHVDLDIKIREGSVKDVKLKVTETKRFYTQAIRGKAVFATPQIVSRICGTCSIAHLTCCTEAIEKALGFKPSDQTSVLRKLAMHGLMIRDHAMHLYIFCLPDILGKDSVLDFDKSQEELIHKAFRIKSAGNNLSKLIAGRAVHPIYEQLGGFSQIPKKEDIDKVTAELKSVRNDVIELIEIFYKCPFEFKRKTHYVALVTDNYDFLEGEIRSSRGICIPEGHYWEHLERVIIPYSEATGFRFEGEEYMVGALARMNMNKENLHKETRKDAAKFLGIFPSENIYHNNLAQAIEVLHSIDRSIELLEISDFKPEPLPTLQPKASEGVGVIEAPRGTLYYMVSINPNGTIRYGNIIIPTAQNQVNMAADIKELVGQIIGKDREYIRHEIEKLIRAYDPCMSCASHFLRIKWA